MPPGPFSFPLIGNVPQIMGNMPHVAMTKLAKTYGKIFTLDVPGQRCVVINSADIAREALVSKKDDFSGRPHLYVMQATTRGGKDIIFGDFSATLVLLRKVTHSALRKYRSRRDLLPRKSSFEVEELCKRFVLKDVDLRGRGVGVKIGLRAIVFSGQLSTAITLNVFS